MTQLLPASAQVRLDERGGKPLALFFWGTNNTVAREDLVAFEAFVKKEKLAPALDVYSVAGFSKDKGSAADVKDMGLILGLAAVPVLADPDFLLSTRLGVDQYPEIVLVGSDGRILAKGIRGVDHGNLQVNTGRDVEAMVAAEYIKRVAATKTGPSLPRTWPFYPSDRLLGFKYSDLALPRFSEEGWGKGKTEKLSSLLSGKRPAMVMFFSATCEHCQVDVPQMVRFQKEHPGEMDIVGITRIRHDNHRKVSAQYFGDQGITFPILEDSGGAMDAWMVTATPSEFYLSPSGAIVKITYYQHDDLEEDWLKLIPKLKAAPPGKPIPEPTGWAFPLTLSDQSGKAVELSSMAGRPTLLHFWATWCVPCRTELPHLLARLPELKARGNVVLASVEKDHAPLAKHRKDTGLAFDSLLAPRGGLAEKIDFSRSVPRTYLLDEHGKILMIQHGTLEWEDPDKFARIAGRMGQ